MGSIGYLWLFTSLCMGIIQVLFGHPIPDWLPNPEEYGDLFEGDIALESSTVTTKFRERDFYWRFRWPGPQNFVIYHENRNAVIDEAKLWPNGVIPYVLDPAISSGEASTFARAVDEYTKNTCIKWVRRTNQASYVRIFKASGCWSFVGQVSKTRKQDLSLSSGCWTRFGTVVHEMMHAVGFHHEQSRTDRDSHVNIQYDNIRTGKENNFRKYSSTKIQHLGTPYDYGSVMHYSKYAFSKNGRPTIVPTIPTANIGQRKGFSANDLKKLNLLYDCNK